LSERILTDNGPEFTGRAMDRWALEHEVKLQFIEPGKPMQNGFVEGFNSTLRDQCLNENWLLGLADAREIIEKWRIVYNNTIKPHSSLNRMTPEEFAVPCPGHARDTSQQATTNPVETKGALT
jgi:putative transposase